MNKKLSFTEGPIFRPLIRFVVPVFLALCLQAMYGAVDLLVVGRFGTAADVSAVATGSQLMQSVTTVITGLAMGTTVLIARRIGEGREDRVGAVVGGGICLFAVLSAAVTVASFFLTKPLCRLMQAPAEAFSETVSYVSICAGGAALIVAYNLLGSVFRGIGDSRTPLLAVLVACIANIGGDLYFVAVLRMAAAGAAIATVASQGLSVLLCLLVIRRRGLPFRFSHRDIRFDRAVIRETVSLGFPIALQDLLVSISFLVILSIVNDLGVIASAGVGVAEKLCGFIMLLPAANMQAMSAFVGQNIGAGRDDRAVRAMRTGMLSSFCVGVVVAYFAFFHGQILAGIFARDPEVVAAAADYLRAYAIDTLLVSFLFCFGGYFSGCGRTQFVMVQGIIGAFGVRIPVAWAMSRLVPVSLFRIALATPCSTVVQILLCTLYFCRMHRKSGPAVGQ